MSCVYTYKGKDYSEDEIVSLLAKEDSISNNLKEGLVNLVNQLGFKVENFEQYAKEYKERTGEDLSENIEAVYDSFKNVLAFKKGTNPGAVTEELAHLVVALLPEDSRLQRALNRIVDSPIYKEYYDTYSKLYKGDEARIQREILAKAMVRYWKENKEGINNPLWSSLRNLWNQFLRLINAETLGVFFDNVTRDVETGKLNLKITRKELLFSASDDISNIAKGLSSIIADQKLRIRKLRSRQLNLSAKEVEELVRNLERDLERNENKAGIIRFINFTDAQINKALKFVQDKEAKNDAGGLTPEAVRNLADFLAFYYHPIQDIRNNLEQFELELEIKEKLYEYSSKFDRIEDFYKKYRTKSNIAKLKEEFKELGYDEENLDFNFNTVFQRDFSDISFFQRLYGKIRDLANPIARAIFTVIAKADIKIRQAAYQEGKGIVELFSGRNALKLDFIADRDSNGKLTGYIKTPYRLHDFYKSYREMREVADAAESEEERLDIINKWKKENQERPYTDEYYAIKESLSPEAQGELEKLSTQQSNIIDLYRNEDLSIDYGRINEEHLEELDKIRIARGQLRSDYHEDGTLKTGVFLSIAKELREYNDKIYGEEGKPNTVDQEAYKEALQKTIKKYGRTSDEVKQFIKLNEEEVLSDEFWALLDDIESREYGTEYDQLKEKRKRLLTPYQLRNNEVQIEYVTEELREQILDIDLRMAEIRRENKGGKPEGETFGKYAKIEPTKQYWEVYKAKRAEGKEAFKEWFDKNHIASNKPISIWTKIVPKKKKYLVKQPNGNWMTFNPESRWYNHNFDPEFAGIQPKLSKYSNPEYDKLTSDQKDTLKEYLKIKQKADARMNVSMMSTYMLPQIREDLNDLAAHSPTLSRLGNLISDQFVRNIEDIELFGEGSQDSKGRQVRFVSRAYTQALDDPETLSRDFLSSLVMYNEQSIKYDEMNRIAPVIENTISQLEEMTFTRGVLNREQVEGNKSETYKIVRSFVDSSVYGQHMRDLGTIRVPLGKDKETGERKVANISGTKLLNRANSFIRANNLMANFVGAIASTFSGSINSFIDSKIGIYSSSKAARAASGELFKNLPDILAQFKKKEKTNSMLLFMERFGIAIDNREVFDNLDKNRLLRLGLSDFTYFGWKQGDFLIKSKMAISVAMSFRYDPKQKTFVKEDNYDTTNTIKFWEQPSFYDAFHKGQVKEEFKDKISDALIARVQTTMQDRNAMIDGQLTDLDKTVAHRDAWLSLTTTHRGFLIDGISRRFKTTTTNYLTGEVETGWYRYFWNNVIKPGEFQKLVQVFRSGNDLKTEEKEAIAKVLLDLAFVAALSVFAKIIHNLSEDDDENYPLQLAAYISNRTLMEITSMSPTPLAITELIHILKSPVPGTNQLDDLMEVNHLLSGEEIERGKWKGYSKRERYLLRLIPGIRGSNSTFNPESSNQFLKSNTLKWLY